MTETTIYIARHGQSEGNVKDDTKGGNPGLTKNGRDQARALAQQFAPITLDQIFASDLVRAKQTAEIVATGRNLSVIEDSRIRERFFGLLEGATDADLNSKYKQELIKYNELSIEEQMGWTLVEDMESLDEVLSRTIAFFQMIAKAYEGKTVLMVTHANVLLSLLAHFNYINSFKELPPGSIQNTAYIKIQKGDNDFQITEVFGITKTIN
jgi:broad specificity phosphatase PhoE